VLRTGTLAVGAGSNEVESGRELQTLWTGPEVGNERVVFVPQSLGEGRSGEG